MVLETALAVIEHFREIVLVDFEFENLSPASGPFPSAWSRTSSRADGASGYSKTSSGRRRPTRSARTCCSSPIMLRAELGCYRALGWPMPERVLDLFAEFRNHTNMDTKADQVRRTPSGAGLLGAMVHFGLDPMDATEKKEMQEAIGNGTWQGRYTPEEILDYCAMDVMALERLLPVMAPHIDLPRALLRGATWPRLPPWSGTAPRSTWRRWRGCGRAGRALRTTWSRRSTPTASTTAARSRPTAG